MHAARKMCGASSPGIKEGEAEQGVEGEERREGSVTSEASPTPPTI